MGARLSSAQLSDSFFVENQRIVGEKHLKLKLRKNDKIFDAMLFFQDARLPDQLNVVYKLGVNEFNGARTLQLTVEHWQPDV